MFLKQSFNFIIADLNFGSVQCILKLLHSQTKNPKPSLRKMSIAVSQHWPSLQGASKHWMTLIPLYGVSVSVLITIRSLCISYQFCPTQFVMSRWLTSLNVIWPQRQAVWNVCLLVHEMILQPSPDTITLQIITSFLFPYLHLWFVKKKKKKLAFRINR